MVESWRTFICLCILICNLMGTVCGSTWHGMFGCGGVLSDRFIFPSFLKKEKNHVDIDVDKVR